MKKMDEPWLNKVRDSLKDYEEPVPFNGWERLERELSASPGFSIYKRRRRYMAVAAVFLLLISSAYIISLYLSGTTLEETTSPVVTLIPDTLDPGTEPFSEEQIVTSLPQYKEVKQGIHPTVAYIPDTQEIIPEAGGEIPAEDKIMEVINQKEEAPDITEEENFPTAVQSPERRKVAPSSKDKLHLPVDTKKARDSRRWSMGLALANTTGVSGAGDNYMEYSKLSLSAMAADGIYSVESGALIVRESNSPYTQRLKDVDYNHRQPVTVGISVRKELSREFSLETGLMYTFLSSDASIDNEYVKKQEQKLHYLGIPLKANWTFWEKSRFSLYVSGGGMVEKSIAGETGYVFTQAGKEMNAGESTYKNSDLKVKELQWSLSAAAGVQYHINRYMGLYVEPGVAYYFDDGSDVQTIRKERPFNFNLQVGFRFSY
ncbi:MAG: PorT family protein [Bacteroides sp.]|nr:PorT family protein [Bacteroides sp.]